MLVPIASTGALLGVLGFVKLIYLAYGQPFIAPVLPDRPYPGGTSVAHDYNSYALSVACGVTACVGLWRFPRIANIATIGAGVAVGAGLLSGSRRFVLVIIVLALIVLVFPRLMPLSRKAAVWRVAIVATVAGALFAVAQAFVVNVLGGRLTAQPALRSGQADTLYTVGRLMTLSDGARIVLARSLQKAVEEGVVPPFRSEDPVISRRMPERPSVGAARLDRWRFGLELYRDSGRTWIGDGFAYGAAFAGRFAVPTGYDYPHNFVISALLYGGLVAAVSLIILLIASLWLYARMMFDSGGAFWPVAFMYGAVGFYSSTSGDTFFSAPVFGVFVVLPLFFLASFERSP
ncbi:MAG: O-antigen ligase family protein [Burkholderiaceae bacterium]|nr:O-antigen ligase family protein [Burkholderiaceae bacterium]